MVRYTRRNGKLVKVPEHQTPYKCTKCHCYHSYGAKYESHYQFREIIDISNIDTGEDDY